MYRGKNTAPEASQILKIINLAEKKLRPIVTQQPSKEEDVQDLFAALLSGAEIPFTRELETIQFADKKYKPDFGVEKLDLAIDIKLTSNADRRRKVPGEISDYAKAFRSKFGNAIFIVYDL